MENTRLHKQWQLELYNCVFVKLTKIEEDMYLNRQTHNHATPLTIMASYENKIFGGLLLSYVVMWCRGQHSSPRHWEQNDVWLEGGFIARNVKLKILTVWSIIYHITTKEHFRSLIKTLQVRPGLPTERCFRDISPKFCRTTRGSAGVKTVRRRILIHRGRL